MEYTCFVELAHPIDDVVQAWSDPENLKYWHEQFMKYEILHGDFIQPGAQTHLFYAIVEKPTCITQTVINNVLPAEIVYEYQTDEFVSRITETFIEKETDTTLWTQKTEYIQFNDSYFESMAKMFSKRFEMKSQVLMDRFKTMLDKVS